MKIANLRTQISAKINEAKKIFIPMYDWDVVDVTYPISLQDDKGQEYGRRVIVTHAVTGKEMLDFYRFEPYCFWMGNYKREASRAAAYARWCRINLSRHTK